MPNPENINDKNRVLNPATEEKQDAINTSLVTLADAIHNEDEAHIS